MSLEQAIKDYMKNKPQNIKAQQKLKVIDEAEVDTKSQVDLKQKKKVKKTAVDLEPKTKDVRDVVQESDQTMPLKDYHRYLAGHDWHHQMSDSNAVYTRGRDNETRLRIISKQSPEHKKMFDSWVNHVRHGGPKPESKDEKEYGVDTERELAAKKDGKYKEYGLKESLDENDLTTKKKIEILKLKSPHVTADHISAALKDKDIDVRSFAIQHPNVNVDHISQALKDKHWGIRYHAIKHPKVTADHISAALKDKYYGIRYHAIKHPKVTADHISTALKDEVFDVRKSAIEHPNATADHISQALNDEDWGVKFAAINHPKATADHISTALKDKNPYVREAAQKRLASLKEENELNEVFSSTYQKIKSMSPEELETLAIDFEKEAEKAIPGTKGHLFMLKQAQNYRTIAKTIQQKKMFEDSVQLALIKKTNEEFLNENDDLQTRKKIEILKSKLPHVNADHITKALKAKAWDVRRAAIKHPNANADHISTALKDKDWSVRSHAILHPNANADHISQALTDKHWEVRANAIRHPNATKDHIRIAIRDKNYYVKEAAQKSLAWLKEENELNEATHSKGGGAKRASIENEGDDHIINQLRKAIDLGSHKVTFKDKKAHDVNRSDARKALEFYSSKRTTDDKFDVMQQLHHSHDSFKNVIAGNYQKTKIKPKITLPGSSRIGGHQNNK